jgi:hypothetical protein
MKLLKNVFKKHHQKTAELLAKATHQSNPGLWLYLNDLRTPLFMLEATARVAEKVYEKSPFFAKIKDKYKALEDAIGALDHYVSFSKAFEVDPKIPAAIKIFVAQRAAEEGKKLNLLLEKAGWLDGSRLKKIEQKLEKQKWHDETIESSLIAQFYFEEIKETKQSALEIGFNFTDLESQVHELRRQLRWLSIYPQALQGAFQFHRESTQKPPAHFQKYLTDAVKNSPFNVMPTTFALEIPILLRKNPFLALSWMIARLGEIKDAGLEIEAIKEALQNTAYLKDAAAFEEAARVLGKKHVTLPQLLIEAGKISKPFFAEKMLDQLY